MVISKKLFDIYNQFEKKPKMIIHDGVDLDKYKPINLERFENISKVIVGWVGNSKFKDSFGDEDMKGVEGIIKPAISELQQEGYNIELNLADRNIKMIPQEEMPNFYNSINLYICASKAEGTPLTVLEAMAMGIPIISTDVGIVSEVLGEKGKKYILEERTKECLKDKIKELINKKEDFKEISKENLIQIKNNDWKNICLKYKEFFEDNLK
jgi:glycosyltransferase involved in cell wall biosynthesis